MPQHSDFLTRFQAGLRDGGLPPGATAIEPAETARRFAVYRNNVTVGLANALAARFPVIRRLVGAEFFASLARHYLDSHRPRSPIIAEWGDSFAGFLAGFPPLSGYPYMADVARLEYARGRAFHAGDAAPVRPAVLSAAPPETLVLGLHPSVAVLRFDHPAVSIWQANQPGGLSARAAKGPEIALLLRDPGFVVQVIAIGAADAALIEGLAAGRPLAHAATDALHIDQAHSVQGILVRLMASGAIIEAGEIAP